jgi:hypothetical protein
VTTQQDSESKRWQPLLWRQKQRWRQDDQIGRIFFYWAFVFFGQFFANCKSSPKFWATFFPQFRFYLNFGEKWLGLHFGRFFHKLIWSPWLAPNFFPAIFFRFVNPETLMVIKALSAKPQFRKT